MNGVLGENISIAVRVRRDGGGVVSVCCCYVCCYHTYAWLQCGNVSGENEWKTSGKFGIVNVTLTLATILKKNSMFFRERRVDAMILNFEHTPVEGSE